MTISAERAVTRAGLASYTTVCPEGNLAPQSKIYQSGRLTGGVPSTSWFSSALWLPHSAPMYPHPLAIKATETGLGVDYPDVVVGKDEQFDSDSILAEYRGDFVVSSTCGLFTESVVDDYSDWTVTLLFHNEDGAMRATAAHGSPYLYFLYDHGDPVITMFETPDVWLISEGSPAVGFTVNGHDYAVFGSLGSRWLTTGQRSLRNAGRAQTHLSLAVLPDREPATVELFRRYAHSHVVGSSVTWRYDPTTSEVRSEYKLLTESREGAETGSIMALYPHQACNLTGEKTRRFSYRSPRGPMTVIEGKGFSTQLKYFGILPVMPVCVADRERLQRYISDVLPEGDHHLVHHHEHATRDMYWTGASLGRIATFHGVADALNEDGPAENAVSWLKATLEEHFSAEDKEGKLKTAQLFYMDPFWKTLIGYPAGFGAETALNDHHYQYGYWIRAAAEIARVDPSWASLESWGRMVELLAKDIACSERDDETFPFLRHFDVYAGHSWAIGNADFKSGNHVESSSESLGAWASLILWGEITGNHELRDTGIYLYATELDAVSRYWFNAHGDSFPARYRHNMVGQIWGGKSSYITWWTDNPEAVRGINILPMTPQSLHLGLQPEVVQAVLAQLAEEEGTSQWSYWPDLFWEYEALWDAESAFDRWSADENYKAGYYGTKAQTYSWIGAFRALGHVDRDVTADTPFYAVFSRNGHRTYVAYNALPVPRTVHYSDGVLLEMPGQGLAMTQAASTP